MSEWIEIKKAEYPDWVFRNRQMYKSGRTVLSLSKRRMKLRMFLYDQFEGAIDREKADYMIDIFKQYFEVNPKWSGLSKVRRRQLYIDKRGLCCYCGIQLTMDQMTVEHVIPKACGGEDDESNYDIACKQCNEERGAELGRLIHTLTGISTRGTYTL